jgi:hypothetical protein
VCMLLQFGEQGLVLLLPNRCPTSVRYLMCQHVFTQFPKRSLVSMCLTSYAPVDASKHSCRDILTHHVPRPTPSPFHPIHPHPAVAHPASLALLPLGAEELVPGAVRGLMGPASPVWDIYQPCEVCVWGGWGHRGRRGGGWLFCDRVAVGREGGRVSVF